MINIKQLTSHAASLLLVLSIGAAQPTFASSDDAAFPLRTSPMDDVQAPADSEAPVSLKLDLAQVRKPTTRVQRADLFPTADTSSNSMEARSFDDVRSSARDDRDLDTQAEAFELNFGALQDDSTEANGWRVNFNTWIWLAGIDGEIGARGLTADVSASFGDILDASDSILAFSGRLEVAKGRWGGFVDGMYMNLGVDDVSGPLGFADIDITFEMILIDFGATYRIGEWTPNGEAAGNSRDITLDLYAGGRYTSLEIELDPAHLAARSRSKDWLDPIVGGKLVLPLNEKWHIAANGDIGGFGVESDFTWSTTAVIGYDFRLFDHPAAVYLGYRAIGWDFTEGSGSNRFTWDVVQHGPILGFSLLF